MPPEIRKLATRMAPQPDVRRSRPGRRHAGELVEHSVYFVEPRDKLSMLQHFLREHGLHADDRLLAHQARGRQDREAAFDAPASAPRRSTATRARTSASGRWPSSSRIARRCWWRPTSRPAASTSTRFRTSSITTCRKCRKCTSTASAAPAAPARRASPRASVGREERDQLRQIERLMQRKLTVNGDEPNWTSEPSPSAAAAIAAATATADAAARATSRAAPAAANVPADARTASNAQRPQLAMLRAAATRRAKHRAARSRRRSAASWPGCRPNGFVSPAALSHAKAQRRQVSCRLRDLCVSHLA